MDVLFTGLIKGQVNATSEPYSKELYVGAGSQKVHLPARWGCILPAGLTVVSRKPRHRRGRR